ncbi:MAG TPA: hypothetical protein ENK85_10010, partial [Saprospiraceae bacterium]|nr:hypothetical protein [Saprospiraceae bacterium]
MNPVKRLTLFMLLAVLSFGLKAQSEGRVLVVKNQSFTENIVSTPNPPYIAGGATPEHGTYSYTQQLSGEYEIKYTPDNDYLGFDEFTIAISNAPGSVSFTTYRFNVVESIVIPKNDYGITDVDVATGMNVINNDFASHPPLTLKNVSFSEGGMATVVNNVINFIPEPGYSGMSQIKYTTCDDLGTCATGMYTVSVFDGELSDTKVKLGTLKDTYVKMPLEWNAYFIAPDQAPSHGEAVINDNQELQYTPEPGYSGEDYFVLTSFNGYQTSLEVFVTVYDKTPNILAFPDQFYTPVNTPVTFNVLANDDGNYHLSGFSQPQAGDLAYNGSGNFTYTPDPNYSGGVYFSYSIGSNYNPNLEKTTVQIGIGNQAPSKGTFDLTTSQNAPLVIKYPTTFRDYGFELINEPNSGVVEFLEGQQTININGEDVSGYNMLIYFPNQDFLGTDEFGLNYCLASNGDCAEVKVTVDVIDAPATCYDGCIWPGDVNRDGVVSVKDILPIGQFFGELGPERSDNSSDWYAHSGDDWNNPYANVDLKFADTDGDGQITAADTSAISTSYAKNDNLTPKFPIGKKNTTIEFGTPSPTNPQPGDLVSIPLILGTEDIPAVDVYGFTFNLNYWVDAFDNEFIAYNAESWFNQNDATLSMAKKPYNGRLESAITRTGRLSASGHGIVGTLNFIIDDQIDGFKLKDGKIEVTLDGGELSDSEGQAYSIDGAKTYIQLNLAGTGLAKINPNQVILYPNPADEEVHIHLNSGFK